MASDSVQLSHDTNAFTAEQDFNNANWDQELQMQPFVSVVGYVALIVYILIFVFGIPANIYVLWRMLRLAKEDHEKYTNGTGVGLLSMAISDLLSLIFISVQNVFFAMPIDSSQTVKSAICKVLLFSTHTATSVSIWSWLLMSALRFLAVRHPIYHFRLWHLPYYAIAVIVLLSALTNVWLLVAVDHDLSGCVQNALSAEGAANRYLHLIENVWSFCIPVIMITIMDAMVLMGSSDKFLIDLGVSLKLNTNTNTHHRSRKAKSTLHKWLFIAFVDILLNMPENMYRLLTLLGVRNEIPGEDEYLYAARIIAQVLYFAQFAFNSLYLALFIYDSNTKPRSRMITVPNHSLSEGHCSVRLERDVIFRRRLQSHKERGCAEKREALPRRSSWHQLEKIRNIGSDRCWIRI